MTIMSDLKEQIQPNVANEANPPTQSNTRCHCLPPWAKILIGIAFLSVLIGLGTGTAVYITNNQKVASANGNGDAGILRNSTLENNVTNSPTRTLSPTPPTTKNPTFKATNSPTVISTRQPTFGLTKSPVRQPTTLVPSTSPVSSDMKFNIDLVYTSAMTDEQKSYFQQAAERWQRIIISDFASTVRAAKGLSICGQPPLTQDLYIDDILIFAGIGPIDGPGKILAQAGPCGFDNAGRIRVGVMKFDQDDLNTNFQAVVKHEMGHVL
jgi:hypothetical protein